MSVFVPETNDNGSPPQQKQPEQSRPKRPRSSLACIRCRKKKVKCDFVQPTCGRCAIAGLPCSYATPPRRVDGHAFDQLGNHVEELKERMQKMQSELAMMKNNLHPFASTSTSANTLGTIGSPLEEGYMDTSGMHSNSNSNMTLATTAGAGCGGVAPTNEQSVTWKLSLSPSGLRIDTNIASVADLYRILLNGISQLNINNDATTSLFSPDETLASNNNLSGTSRHKHTLSKPFLNGTGNNGLASGNNGRRGAGAAGGNVGYLDTNMLEASNNDKGGGRLWEVDDVEARKILQEKKAADDVLPKEVLTNLMHTCYHNCFLAYQIVDKDQFMQQYMSDEGLDPLLLNSINAWVSKHGCIYHNIGGGNSTTMGEVYFKNARQLLKKCFDISSPTTIHALLNLYMYQLSSERSSLAYLYIGLAIRMAQDLKFHKKEHMSADLKQRETNKRLWWSAYWLDLCAALESNRPTMVDDKDCDLDYPVRLEHEDDETGYRIQFTVYSIKLMRIRKDITKHLPSEQSGQSLLSAISRLENALTNWLSELPPELHFDDHATNFQKTGSFKDEACLILNIEYQTTWIMLHKFFLPKPEQTATPVALLSLNICTKSANLITRMLSLYAANLHWCQFFYAMDGIIASVTIHQVNALSSEKEVSCLAQRNLIITANVLKESPLMYMVRVCEIIESIEGFLKKNNLSSNLNDLPSVDEDSVNQQSISSVFHPAIFETQQQQQQQHMMRQQQQQAQVLNAPTTPQAQQQQSQQQHLTSQQQQLQQRQAYTNSLSPSIHSPQTMLNSPQSQHSASTNPMQVPSQLSQAMFPHQQQKQHQQHHPALSQAPPQLPQTISAAGQPTLTKNIPQLQAQPQITQNQQQGQHNNNNLYGNPNATTNIMMDTSGMFVNDPTSLMGFNLPGQGEDMNQLLLRNMGFDLSNMNSNNIAAAAVASNNGRMFNMFNPTTANPNMNNPNGNNAYSSFTSNFNPSMSTPIPSPATAATATTTTAPTPTPQQQQQQQTVSQQNNPNNNTTYPNFLNNADIFAAATPQGFSANSNTSSTAAATATAFDPTAFFGTMNMDPATMSALLYNGAGLPGFPSSPFQHQPRQQQQHQQQGSVETMDETNTASPSANSGRKRVHRDWEDAA
ncbi:fungal-specific transcription factor domain-containing protein [Mycotypha africana]|uniref:fungal-specific transcription factor domain-containing protein n=1 Tax=Mycotypha africana TaxID=64632 RepID=UPI0023003376|nr:fungal-specific transcription factor domain-containing protein [Mycotypha africana]KAI8975607.1 fungal-specific transcription factor domain-containing protein [Mycotypha africana]